jgi:hypothetical protein
MEQDTATAGRGVPKQRGFTLRKSSQSQPESITAQIEALEKKARIFKSGYRRRVPASMVDDIWQNAVGNYLVHLQRGGEVDDPVRYMHRVCANAANTEMAKLARRAEVLVDDATQHARIEEILAQADHAEKYTPSVRDILAEVLTEEQHLAYVLTYVYRLTSDEAGQQFGTFDGMSEKTGAAVRQTLRRINRKLKEPTINARLMAEFRRRTDEYDPEKSRKPKKKDAQ